MVLETKVSSITQILILDKFAIEEVVIKVNPKSTPINFILSIRPEALNELLLLLLLVGRNNLYRFHEGILIPANIDKITF